MAPLDEQIKAALTELLADENYTLPFDSLPKGDLSRWYDLQIERRATEATQQQTLGPDQLTSVPHARIRATTHANITLNTNTLITFTTEVFDQGDMANLAVSATRLTMPRTGLYYVEGNILWVANSTNNARIAWLSYNGTNTIAIDQDEAQAEQIGQNLSTIYRFKRGDFVNLAVNAESTTALDCTTGAAPVLTACFLTNYTPEALPYAV